MSLLDAYLQGMGEQITWRQKTGVDQYGDPAYNDDPITVVWFDEQKIVYNAKGTELLCDAYFLTDKAIAEGDAVMRGGITWPVIGFSKTPTFCDYGPKMIGLSRS